MVDQPRGAAFFDLDRTIISGSSTYYFGIAAWRNDMLSGRQLLGDARDAILFRLMGATDEKSAAIRDRILSTVEGANQADLAALNEEIIPAILERVRPESQGLIEMHHEAGRDCYIASASPQGLVEPLAQALGMEGGIGTVPEVIDGCYTGRLAGPFVYGPGKAEAVAKLAADRNYDLRLSYAYSDSASDLPLLELVGHPVAVNPDGPLQAIAHQRGWPIVIFSRRTKMAVRNTTAAVGAVTLATTTYFVGRRHGRIQSEATRGRLIRNLPSSSRQ